MSNRWVSALVKTIVFLVIVHVVLLVLGFFMGNGVGFFGLRMLWPHWHNVGTIWISIGSLLIIYFIIYGFFTTDGRDD